MIVSETREAAPSRLAKKHTALTLAARLHRVRQASDAPLNAQGIAWREREERALLDGLAEFMPDAGPTPPSKRQAIERLYAETGPRMRHYLRSLGADPATADDVVQEVFAAILRSPAAQLCKLSEAYAIAAARNCYISGRTREARRRTLRRARAAAASPRGEGGDERARSAERVHSAMAEGLASQMDAFRLVTMRGLTYEQAGASLGVRASTIVNRVHRARVQLRKSTSEATP